MSDEQSEYVFTLMPDRSIAVWHPGLQEPYILVRGSCSCPGATYRGWCKHQDWFRAGSIRPWNQGLTTGFFHIVRRD